MVHVPLDYVVDEETLLSLLVEHKSGVGEGVK